MDIYVTKAWTEERAQEWRRLANLALTTHLCVSRLVFSIILRWIQNIAVDNMQPSYVLCSSFALCIKLSMTNVGKNIVLMLLILGANYGIFYWVTRSLPWFVFHHLSSKVATSWFLVWCLPDQPCRHQNMILTWVLSFILYRLCLTTFP